MRASPLLRRASVLAAALALGTATGCNEINKIGPNCDRSIEGNPEEVFTQGTVEDGVYMSSPWEGELLWFPGGMRYALQHKLGKTPRFVELWLSFKKEGIGAGTLAPAAGNQAELRLIDDQKLVVVNGSCADYWLLVVAGGADGETLSPDDVDLDDDGAP